MLLSNHVEYCKWGPRNFQLINSYGNLNASPPPTNKFLGPLQKFPEYQTETVNVMHAYTGMLYCVLMDRLS